MLMPFPFASPQQYDASTWEWQVGWEALTANITTASGLVDLVQRFGASLKKGEAETILAYSVEVFNSTINGAGRHYFLPPDGSGPSDPSRDVHLRWIAYKQYAAAAFQLAKHGEAYSHLSQEASKLLATYIGLGKAVATKHQWWSVPGAREEYESNSKAFEGLQTGNEAQLKQAEAQLNVFEREGRGSQALRDQLQGFRGFVQQCKRLAGGAM